MSLRAERSNPFKIIQVAVGVLINNQNQILIAKRPLNKPFGGLWEFPGGKIEADELPTFALKRELFEELKILITGDLELFTPFYEINYEYQPDVNIHLIIYKIKEFSGDPIGAEGQEIKWVEQHCLINYPFPAANQEIIELLTQNK